MNVQAIYQRWEIEQPLYQLLGETITRFIKKELPKYEILPELSFRTKETFSILKKIKKKREGGKSDYDYQNINDKLGIRIICSFSKDLATIDEFLNANFSVNKVEYKKDLLDYDRLDYISNHYDIFIDSGNKIFEKCSDISGSVFEIQVRTLNQHVWSNLAHSLSYKQDMDISPVNKRRIYRLLSLYEIADDEFETVNKALQLHPENEIYILIRKIERAFYRFAQIDFDRDISISNLKKILSFFSEEEINSVFSSIDKFIDENKMKINLIFEENRIRFHEFLFLTQPEIFVIWFLIENYPYKLINNWTDHFDYDELQTISILWGHSIEKF